MTLLMVFMVLTGLAALAGGAILYLLSVATVDVFAGEAHALRPLQAGRLDELVKEAQVALSVLWTAVGVVVLGLGLLLRQAELRIAGLAVLGPEGAVRSVRSVGSAGRCSVRPGSSR